MLNVMQSQMAGQRQEYKFSAISQCFSCEAIDVHHLRKGKVLTGHAWNLEFKVLMRAEYDQQEAYWHAQDYCSEKIIADTKKERMMAKWMVEQHEITKSLHVVRTCLYCSDEWNEAI